MKEKEITQKELEGMEEDQLNNKFEEAYGNPEPEGKFYDTLEEKMEKVDSLFIFYKKEGIKIKFRLTEQPNIEIKGEILKVAKKNILRGESFVIIKDENTPKVKVFLEEVEVTTILPIEIKITPSIEFKREYISPKIRFDILKRDKKTCQYCGREAPEVILEVDHIKPVSKGGTDDSSNLTTSCRDCNRGKTNSEL